MSVTTIVNLSAFGSGIDVNPHQPFNPTAPTAITEVDFVVARLPNLLDVVVKLVFSSSKKNKKERG